MNTLDWKARMGQVGVAIAVLALGAWVNAQDPPSVGEQLRRAVDEAVEATGQPFIQPGGHWIGVTVATADGTLVAQLNFPEEQGLVVRRVADESPAAAAGLKEHDVLIKAGETILYKVSDLAEAVEIAAAEEADLSVELVRSGETIIVDVTPAERPGRAFGIEMPAEADSAINSLLEALGQEGDRPWFFEMPQPGVILPDVLRSFELPEDLTITITRSGSEPASITVQRGEETWELSEEDLSELPGEVRQHVERMLHPLMAAWPLHAGDRPDQPRRLSRNDDEPADDRDTPRDERDARRGGDRPRRAGGEALEERIERILAPLIERLEDRLDSLQERIDRFDRDADAVDDEAPSDEGNTDDAL